MRIGVLALQGDFAEHIEVLKLMGIDAIEVRSVADLSGIDGLIIPGGESTTMHQLLSLTGLDDAIKQSLLPILGTCAGAILLADLGMIDIKVQRNAYGRQLQSKRVDINLDGKTIPVSFIRAPKITDVGKGVEVVAEYDGDPVLVRQANILVSTFHTEVTGSTTLHQLFTSSLAAASSPSLSGVGVARGE